MSRASIKRIAALIASASMSGACVASDSERLLDIVFLRYDDIAKSTTLEVVPFVRIETNGAFAVVEQTEEGDIDALKGMLEHRATVIFQGGRPILKPKLREFGRSEYQCSTLAVGRTTAPDSLKGRAGGPRSGSNGYSNGKQVRYSAIPFLGLTVQKDTFGKTLSGEVKPAWPARERVIGAVTAALGMPEESLHLVDVVPFGTDPSTATRWLVTAEAHAKDESRHSVIGLLDAAEGSELMKLDSTINESDAWGDGFKIVDVIDVDGDGSLEFVVEESGYESTGYRLYGLRDGKLTVLANAGLFGC